MKLLALLLLVVCARCQEEERTDTCVGQPIVNCNCNQDENQSPSPSSHRNGNVIQGKPGKVGPPGVRGQKGEAGGLNYTLAQSLKRELDDVKTNLSLSETKFDAVTQELAAVKANLSSSEAKFHAVNQELADVKMILSSSEAQFRALNQEVDDVKTNLESRQLLVKSCSDHVNVGNGTTENNGEYLINPNPNYVNPFKVFCNFSGTVPETVIRHNSMDEYEFTGCEDPFCYKRRIVYGATMRQISALIQMSRNCRQFIKLRCIGSAINWSSGTESVAGWLSRDGTRKLYWGGATSRRPHYCACAESDSCSNSQYKCNCDQNNSTQTSDEGFLTYKYHLPVTELQFGDASPPGERGWHTLGPLICSD